MGLFAKLLKTYKDQLGSIVKVLHGEDNVIDIIYVQIQVHRDLYKQFGEIVQLDSTYRTNRTAMPLYTLMVVDNFWVVQPAVAIIFMKDENTQNIQTSLELFAKVFTFTTFFHPLS